MKCLTCKHELQEGAKFCSMCGKEVQTPVEEKVETPKVKEEVKEEIAPQAPLTEHYIQPATEEKTNENNEGEAVKEKKPKKSLSKKTTDFFMFFVSFIASFVLLLIIWNFAFTYNKVSVGTKTVYTKETINVKGKKFEPFEPISFVVKSSQAFETQHLTVALLKENNYAYTLVGREKVDVLPDYQLYTGHIATAESGNYRLVIYNGNHKLASTDFTVH